jgi:4'-phosphopantetheinyl transferase
MDFLWEAAPAVLKLGEGSIHVFCSTLDVPAKRREALARTLSLDEQQRAERFHFERDRQRFVVGRGTLREILGCLLEVDPAGLSFSYGKYGKPRLAGTAAARGLCFNVAHSDSMALYAIADREIGVDVEHIRPVAEAEQVALRFFAPRERSCYQSLPPERRLEAFFNCWTRKEAYLKALGAGLRDWLAEIEVSLAPGEPARLLAVPGDLQSPMRWLLHALAPAADYVGAVAFQSADPRVSCWHWAG